MSGHRKWKNANSKQNRLTSRSTSQSAIHRADVSQMNVLEVPKIEGSKPIEHIQRTETTSYDPDDWQGLELNSQYLEFKGGANYYFGQYAADVFKDNNMEKIDIKDSYLKVFPLVMKASENVSDPIVYSTPGSPDYRVIPKTVGSIAFAEMQQKYDDPTTSETKIIKGRATFFESGYGDNIVLTTPPNLGTWNGNSEKITGYLLNNYNAGIVVEGSRYLNLEPQSYDNPNPKPPTNHLVLVAPLGTSGRYEGEEYKNTSVPILACNNMVIDSNTTVNHTEADSADDNQYKTNPRDNQKPYTLLVKNWSHFENGDINHSYIHILDVSGEANILGRLDVSANQTAVNGESGGTENAWLHVIPDNDGSVFMKAGDSSSSSLLIIPSDISFSTQGNVYFDMSNSKVVIKNDSSISTDGNIVIKNVTDHKNGLEIISGDISANTSILDCSYGIFGHGMTVISGDISANTSTLDCSYGIFGHGMTVTSGDISANTSTLDCSYGIFGHGMTVTSGDISANTSILDCSYGIFGHGMTVTSGDISANTSTMDCSYGIFGHGMTVTSGDISANTSTLDCSYGIFHHGMTVTSGDISANTSTLDCSYGIFHHGIDMSYGIFGHGMTVTSGDISANTSTLDCSYGIFGHGMNVTSGDIYANTSTLDCSYGIFHHGVDMSYASLDCSYGIFHHGIDMSYASLDCSYGNFHTVNCTTLTQGSDIKKKDTITPISNALNVINSLNGKSFCMKEDPSKRKHYGIIAQEAEAVLPEIIYGEEGDKRVAYIEIIGLLIEAVKELENEVIEIKGKLDLDE